ncbi:MAG: putative selenium-dependent hydroxylase accessory protein YqeC [Chloroflexi bacterium]|nr:putative selenium-dependent hydroxylase accessory protein YqeC [Chloroflexota bacterium]
MRLAEAILREGERTVALVGGGGKTTSMYRLAVELADAGKRVVVTTTTHIMPPEPHEAEATVVAEDLAIALNAIAEKLRTYHVIGVGSRITPDGKLKGVPQEWVAEIARLDGLDLVIVEADGAACKPFKAPADHEPVIPSCADVVVPIVGVDVVGQPICRETIHRPERVCAIGPAKMGEPVTVDVVARVLLHPLGLAKGAPDRARIVPLINKVDGPSSLAVARAIAGLLLAAGTDRVVIGRAAYDPPVVEVAERVHSPTGRRLQFPLPLGEG